MKVVVTRGEKPLVASGQGVQGVGFPQDAALCHAASERCWQRKRHVLFPGEVSDSCKDNQNQGPTITEPPICRDV